MADQTNQLPLQAPPTGMFPNPLLQAQPPTPNLDEQTARSMQMGQEAFAGEQARRQQLAQQVNQLMQQQQGLQIPKMGPQIQPGAGFGHNLGQVLEMVGGMTGPGRALEGQIYGPGIRQYEAQRGQLANQIQQIQGQMGPETGAMQAAAGLAERPMGALGQYYRGLGSMGEAQAAGTRAEAAMMDARTRAEVDRQRVQLEAQANQIRQQLGQGKINVEQARTQMMKYVADTTNSMRQNVASMFTDQRQAAVETQAAEQDYKTQADHILQSILGIGPQKPVTPAIGSQKPVTQQKPQGKTGQQGKGTVRLQSGGTYYNVPRHMVGEFKKDHPDAR